MKLTAWRRKRLNSVRDACVRSRPATTIRPELGVSSAPTRFSSVVLPLPEGPSTTTNSFSDTHSATASNAVTVLPPTVYSRHTSLSSINTDPEASKPPQLSCGSDARRPSVVFSAS